MKLLKLSTQINSEMVALFSQDQVEMLENSNMKLKLDKLESIFQFQYLFQCSVSPETKTLCGEQLISTVRAPSTSIHNGKPSLQDGRK